MELIRRQNDYTEQLTRLMPVGRLWDSLLGLGKLLRELLEVIACELLQVETRIDDLKNELMPDKTRALISRWESILGLPDPCTGQLATVQQRITAILGKLLLLGVKRGSLSQQFYIDLAARHGYSITITVLSANNWQVNVPGAAIIYFRAGVSSSGDPLQSSDNSSLQCVINRHKPAHTNVTFNYT